MYKRNGLHDIRYTICTLYNVHTHLHMCAYTSIDHTQSMRYAVARQKPMPKTATKQNKTKTKQKQQNRTNERTE